MRRATRTKRGARSKTVPSITAYPAAIADGGFPDGRCVHGATGCQTQSPAHVPAISSVAVASQIPAKSVPRPERRMHQANSGQISAPDASIRWVQMGSTVSPATVHAVQMARTMWPTLRSWARISGSEAAVIPNT